MGTVTGRVLAWPCAPVENLNSPCAGRPVPNVQITFTRTGGGGGGDVTTDNTGSYAISLLPGTYAVALKNLRPMRGPNQVKVIGGQVTNQDFIFDSGIRLPVPNS